MSADCSKHLLSLWWWWRLLPSLSSSVYDSIDGCPSCSRCLLVVYNGSSEDKLAHSETATVSGMAYALLVCLWLQPIAATMLYSLLPFQ